MGVSDVTVLTQRAAAAVASPMPSVVMGHFEEQEDDPCAASGPHGGRSRAARGVPGRVRLIVNCIRQDTDAPLMFVTDEELALFRPGAFFIDVACDAGMGFEWARPTTLASPSSVGPGCHYYGVDHSPSICGTRPHREISEALLPYLRKVMSGPVAWDADAHGQKRHRNSRRSDPEPEDSLLPAPGGRVSPRPRGPGAAPRRSGGLTTPGEPAHQVCVGSPGRPAGR